MGNFSPNGIAHLLVASQMFGALPDMHLHLVSLKIFNQVSLPLDILEMHPWLCVYRAGADPSKEAAAAADVVVTWFVCLPVFSFADTGATIRVTAAKVTAAIMSIECWACAFITILLAMNTAGYR